MGVSLCATKPSSNFDQSKRKRPAHRMLHRCRCFGCCCGRPTNEAASQTAWKNIVSVRESMGAKACQVRLHQLTGVCWVDLLLPMVPVEARRGAIVATVEGPSKAVARRSIRHPCLPHHLQLSVVLPQVQVLSAGADPQATPGMATWVVWQSPCGRCGQRRVHPCQQSWQTSRSGFVSGQRDQSATRLVGARDEAPAPATDAHVSFDQPSPRSAWSPRHAAHSWLPAGGQKSRKSCHSW